MADKGKTYWIGDNKDEKSALIGGEFYLPGDVIPIDKVDKVRLDNWIEKGMVSIGAYHAPIIARDTETVKALESEIRNLNAKLDAMPALERQNAELKDELKKAKSGKKADAVKELEENAIAQSERIEKLETIGADRFEAIKVVEADVKEKAALIEKQAARITELEADVEKLTAPNDGGGAGPGSK